MVKMGKMLLLLCLMLTGCARPAQASDNRFVTRVDVTLTQNEKTRKWSFTDPQKMEVVLYYLRYLDHTGTPKTDPERYGGDCYRIDLRYTDGKSCRIYQRGHFISRDLKPWDSVDPKEAALLYPLLANLRSD